ncbi:MAG: LacI family DNA-binding transcriptional regulator [Brevinema sp.]
MTIREIAHLTGLSTTTICKALRNPNSVRKSTWEQICKIQGGGEDLGLSQVHIIIPDLQNSFFAELLEGCLNYLSPNGFDPKIYLSLDDPHRESSFFHKILNRSTEGIIWVPSAHGKSSIPPHPRVILADRDILENNLFDKVLVDNKNLAFQAVQYLKTFHKDNIYFINGPQESSIVMDRSQGALDAAHQLGVDLKIYYADFTDEKKAYNTSKKILASSQSAAYLLGNQTIAYGFLKALQGSKEKNNIPCITFDRFPYGNLFYTPISYIDLNAYQIGKKAAQLLLESTPYQDKQQIFTMPGHIYLVDQP